MNRNKDPEYLYFLFAAWIALILYVVYRIEYAGGF
jgi:hypothetical protein